MVWEKWEKEKNLANYVKISHYQQVGESRRILLQITSIIHVIARRKSVKGVSPESRREICGL